MVVYMETTKDVEVGGLYSGGTGTGTEKEERH